VDDTSAHATRSRRQQLGDQLRTAREAAGISVRRLARDTRLSPPMITRIELGRGATEEEIVRCARALGVDEATASGWVALALQSLTELQPWRSRVARTQEQIGNLERSARLIRTFQPSVIVGLAQTEAYARRVLTLADHDDVESAVRGRLARQEILDDPTIRFEWVMTEGALRWNPGPAGVHADQLRHLTSLVGRERVTVGVLPYAIEAPAVYDIGFSLYTPRDDADLPVVEYETPDDDRRMMDPRVIAAYERVWDRVRGAAVTGDQARALLSAIVAGDQL
jgi:transcriptional regulator with XRE-family HTH domain